MRIREELILARHARGGSIEIDCDELRGPLGELCYIKMRAESGLFELSAYGERRWLGVIIVA